MWQFFKRDGLVTDAGLFGNIDGVIAAGVAIGAETQAFAVDQPRAGDADVVDAFAPQQRIVPMIMTVVLKGIPLCIWFGGIIGAAVVACLLARQWRIGCQDGASLVKNQVDLALQVD